jgi:hypothetical protein
MDNFSTKKKCISFYQEILGQTSVFRFEGLHNSAHDTRIFSDFYDAIRDSCKFFIFIDSDEFLFRYFDNRLIADAQISADLAHSNERVIPCLWVENMPGSDRAFRISESALQSGMRWGKPIVRTSNIPLGYINHNSQISADHYDADLDGRHIILHLSKLFTKQRIDVNIEKLKQRGFFETKDFLPEAVNANINTIDNRHIKAYVAEIQDAVSEPFETREYIHLLTPNDDKVVCIDMGSGEIEFYNEEQKTLFEKYASYPSAGSEILNKYSISKKSSSEATEICNENPEYGALSMRPHMTSEEMKMFARHLEPVKFLLEFGSGGSTVLAASLGVSKIHSVDSSSEWLSNVGRAPEVQGADYTPHYIDIGKLAKWGNPADTASAIKWPAYYNRAWDEIGTEPDLVLVDGRFRVMCTLMTILKCSSEIEIILHDFWSRPHYHVLLKFLDCIDRIDDLGVFVPKPDLNWQGLGQVLAAHVLDYR